MLGPVYDQTQGDLGPTSTPSLVFSRRKGPMQMCGLLFCNGSFLCGITSKHPQLPDL